MAARLRRFAARLSAEDVLPNSKAYVVAALFPDEASAAAAAAHLKGAADAMFAAAKVPCALPCVLLKQEVERRLGSNLLARLCIYMAQITLVQVQQLVPQCSALWKVLRGLMSPFTSLL